MNKPHITRIKEGPARGLWRCQKTDARWRGACFGTTPSAAYKRWAEWAARAVQGPVLYTGVGA